MIRHPRDPVSVLVIGGGLAGLSAAVALAPRGFRVMVLESRQRLGGRAGSFADPATGQLVDACQHVSMGCCTNLADFCRRTGIADCFRRDRLLHFFGPDGVRNDFAAAAWLPAPLHLGPAFMRFSYLTLRERIAAASGLWRLARTRLNAAATAETIADWLRRDGQSPRVIDRFWNVVLVSALSESLDRISIAAARQVFVEGFMAHRRSYEIEVPQVPLGVIYSERMLPWLAAQGVAVRLGTPVRRVSAGGQPGMDLLLHSDGEVRAFDYIICAVTWRSLAKLVDEELRMAMPELREIGQIESAPITGVHLWFDRDLTELPHAVLVGRLSQWVFRRAVRDDQQHYYQVVISASRQLAGRDRDAIVSEVCDDLRAIWPPARDARLLRARVVTDQEAVFSVRPGMESCRPSQQTAIRNLALAGDWTHTGWPSTMEGAVRSGYLAAEAALAAFGTPERILQPSLPRGWLARLLMEP
jgi:squalene-associated FAD-dependent desaturase